MKPIMIVFDTNTLRSTNKNSAAFKTLQSYSQKGSIKLIIPHIVREEWRTQLREDASIALTELKSKIQKIKKIHC